MTSYKVVSENCNKLRRQKKNVIFYTDPDIAPASAGPVLLYESSM